MASCFRILCALSDQRALYLTDKGVADICNILLDGSNAPVPNLVNVKYLLSVLQGIHDCLAGDEYVSASTTFYSREPSLLRRTVTKDPSMKTNTGTIHGSVASSILSKSMLDHPLSSENNTEELVENDFLTAKNFSQKRTQQVARHTKDLAEKNQYAIEKYIERMNRAYITRTRPTRLETMNDGAPLSRRRAREIQSTQELIQYLDSCFNYETPISSLSRRQQG